VSSWRGSVQHIREQVQSFADLFRAKGGQFLRSVELPLLERKLLDGQLELLEELRSRISLVESIKLWAYAGLVLLPILLEARPITVGSSNKGINTPGGP